MNDKTDRSRRKTMKAFFADLKTVTKEAEYLPLIFADNHNDHPFLFPETLRVIRPTLFDFSFKLLFTDKHFRQYTTMPIVPDTVTTSYDGSCWFFINGMVTDPSAIRLHADALFALFGRRINILHNPTDGLKGDILEAMLSRTLGVSETVSPVYKASISQALTQGCKVVILAHSQGSIILANVLRQLQADPLLQQYMAKIECYTFAGGFDEWPVLNAGIQVEHFANEYDYVARIGVLQSKAPQGPVHVREGATGHLLNKHYLSAFRKRVYCGGKSHLYSYLVMNT